MGISYSLDVTDDDVLWTADSNSRENDDAASEEDWGTDEQMCLADYIALFGDDESSDELNFWKMNNEWLWTGFIPHNDTVDGDLYICK